MDQNKYPFLQQNTAQVKGDKRILPKPIVVVITVNGHPAQALLDSGSLGDFMASTLADQLSIKQENLDSPVSLQLSMQGSRSKVNARATVELAYQNIQEYHVLDIINLNNYDFILGTPWMHQHQVCLGFNPVRVVIGSDESLPLKVGNDMKMMVHALSIDDKLVDEARIELQWYAKPLCKEVSKTELPPFHDINHSIPLIDNTKIYPWHPSKCPEIFRLQWVERWDAYIKSGQWKITPAGNTIPMLLIPKLGTNPPLLRVVVDLHE